MSKKIEELRALNNDKHLKIYDNYQQVVDIIEKSPIYLAIDKNPQGQIYTLIGPRQVGKSTLIKMLGVALSGKHNLEGHWIDVSLCESPKELSEELKKLILDLPDQTGVLLVDEISTVPNWQLALRSLHAEGLLKKILVVCTGSSSKGISDASERLPGRKGGGKTFYLFPHSFFEWIKEKQPTFQQKLAENFKSSAFSQTPAFLHKKSKDFLFLKEPWQNYLLAGGFPIPREEFYRHKTISDTTFEVYRDWILGEWSKTRVSFHSIRTLCLNLIENLGKLSSWESLKKNTDIASHSTVKSIIEDQEKNFALSILRNIDPGKKIFLNSKQKKIYPIDPFIAHVFYAIGKGVSDHFFAFIKDQLQDKSYYSKIAELAIVSQLHQGIFLGNLGYIYSSQTGTEIDCAVLTPEAAIGVEVKTGEALLTPKQIELSRHLDAFYPVGESHKLIDLSLFAWLVSYVD